MNQILTNHETIASPLRTDLDRLRKIFYPPTIGWFRRCWRVAPGEGLRALSGFFWAWLRSRRSVARSAAHREVGGMGERQGEIEEELPGHRGTGAARGSLKGILRTPICLRSAPIPAHHIHHVRPRRTHMTTGIRHRVRPRHTSPPLRECPLEGLLYSAPSTRCYLCTLPVWSCPSAHCRWAELRW